MRFYQGPSNDHKSRLAEALNEAHDRANSSTYRQTEQYQLSLRELEGLEDRICDDLKNGVLDEVGYRRHLDRLSEERRRLTGLLENSQINLNGAFRETASSILELAAKAKSLWYSRSPKKRRDFLDKILSNPRLNGTTVEFNLENGLLCWPKWPEMKVGAPGGI